VFLVTTQHGLEGKIVGKKTIVLTAPDDGHFHGREESYHDLLSWVLPPEAKVFARAVIEPNLMHGRVSTVDHVRQYRGEIQTVLDAFQIANFQPLMTVRITPRTTPAMIGEFKKAKVLAGKLYPDGVTTGSEGGVSNFKDLYPVFAEMQRLGFPLRVHAEMPGVDSLYAEQAFIAVLTDIISKFPNLRIVIEHVSSAAMFGFIESARSSGIRIGATVTPHHLVLTAAKVFSTNGLVIFPDNFCKPPAKQEADQEAIVRYTTSGFDWIWLGTDSAPHPWWLKRRSKNPKNQPKAGCYCGPVAMAVYAHVFEAAKALDRLDNFASRYFAEYFGLTRNTATIQLVREPYKVPKRIGPVRLFLGGQTLNWQVISA